MSITALSTTVPVIHLDPRQTGLAGPAATPAGRSAADAKPARPDDQAAVDPVAEIIKQMQERLRQVMLQIQRLQESKIPAEQKMQRLKALNAEAALLQQQISAALQRRLRGGVTA